MTAAVPDRRRSSADEVLDRLRTDILGGVFAPGTRLKFSDLADRYSVSMGVLREVLTRLVEQRLVTSEPRIGFRVGTLSADDMRDLTQTRIDIEGVAVEHAIAQGGIDWESALVAAHHRLERTPLLTKQAPVRVSDEWESAHAAFHRAVLAGCGSPRLLDITDGLRDCAELYRRWSGVRDPERDVAGEHRAIAEAALAHDAPAARRALAEHYQRTLDITIAAGLAYEQDSESSSFSQ